MVLCGFCGSDLLLHVLLPALSELEGLPHAVQLPDAIVVVSAVVIVSEAILVLGRLNHDQYVNINHSIFLVFLGL